MIPLIAMAAVGLLSALWPGPKVDPRTNDSGAIFQPQITVMDRKHFTAVATINDAPQESAPEDIYQDYTKLTPVIESKKPKWEER